MLLKIFHFLLNLAAVSLNSTNRFSFFICTPMFECCHFLIYKAKERPSRGTWQCCWDLFPFKSFALRWSSGGAFPNVLEEKLEELFWISMSRNTVKSVFFHVQNHVHNEFPQCCWRNKESEIYKSTLAWFTWECWCSPPSSQAQLRNHKRPSQMFSGHRAEDRNTCLGAEINRVFNIRNPFNRKKPQ